ncbi:MAG: hypothetical protein WCH34_06010, partial [Bacteroidota bacterium]
MDTRDTNRFNMIGAATGYLKLDTNSTIIALRGLIGTTLTKVEADMETIELLNVTATGSTKGITADVITLRRTMTKLGITISSAIFAYAWSLPTPNEALAESVNFSPSSFPKMSKEEVDDNCERIHSVGLANVTDLAEVGVTAPMLAAFGVSIDNYRNAMGKPRLAIVGRETANQQISDLIRSNIDVNFEKIIDRLVLSLKSTYPAFYDGYMKSREIVDLGHTYTKFRGTANDVNGDPLLNAHATLTSVTKAELVYVSTSNQFGRFENV